jgi:hypothetical protein
MLVFDSEVATYSPTLVEPLKTMLSAGSLAFGCFYRFEAMRITTLESLNFQSFLSNLTLSKTQTLVFCGDMKFRIV